MQQKKVDFGICVVIDAFALIVAGSASINFMSARVCQVGM